MKNYKVDEIKNMLAILGVSKTGKKADLVNRLKGTVCDEGSQPTPSPKLESKKTTPEHILKLAVPFDQKDAAKQLGARWFAEKKVWWVTDTKQNRDKFATWLPSQPAAAAARRKLSAYNIFMKHMLNKLKTSEPEITLRFKKAVEAWKALSPSDKEKLKKDIERDPQYLDKQGV